MSHQQNVGIISDEHPDPGVTLEKIRGFVENLEQWFEAPWYRPRTFLGVGGHNVFRDLVYENRAFLSADHRYYRDQRLYDYPSKKLKQRAVNRLLLTAFGVPVLGKALKREIRDGKMKPYERFFAGFKAEFNRRNV